MHVHYDADRQVWHLSWKDVLLRLRLAEGALWADYFGPAGWVDSTSTVVPFPDAIWATQGMAHVELGPQRTPMRWQLVDWSQASPATLILRLRAVAAPLMWALSLCYDKPSGLLILRSELMNESTDQPLDIACAVSVGLCMPAHVRDIVHLSGRWGAETQVQRLSLPYTSIVLESRAGKTGFEHAPYIALLAGDYTYVFELAWSGNWRMQVRRLADGCVTLSAGLNDWGLRHRLRPGETLILPEVFALCVQGDLNTATHCLHDYRRRFPAPDTQHPVPVQFNTWYVYNERVPVEQMKAAADAAAALGCEVFVLDAGWYTTEEDRADEGWWARTGDWIVNRRWFPNGLHELSEHCRARGLDFGIWFEPEAVGPSATLRRHHPEWMHAIGGIPTPGQQRAILHLGVPEARAFIRERILDVLRAGNAEWMKWDFNTDLRQGGWAAGLPEELTDQDPLIAHYRGLYQLQGEIREAIPGLTLEMCAGGGGRFDAAILANAHVNWMSDQTNALMNLAIHFGSQLAHCAFECNDWLVEWPPHSPIGAQTDLRGDLAFRTRVAMLGSFGISAPIDRWSDEERSLVKAHVDWYKQIIQPIVLNGDQYFLTEPPPLDGNGDWAAVWYAAKSGERGVLFAFRLAGVDAQRLLPLPGLKRDARYRLRTPEGWLAEYSGAELSDGLSVELDDYFRSALIYVEQVQVA
ncbi:MAG: alpha-galactosidase [Anaerolineae bacterium]|nr:alpha-galactosidase [Thermoflexales bacterium]MDW8406787.1 alpha-galactosidase [Anaerolineae bacterium]